MGEGHPSGDRIAFFALAAYVGSDAVLSLVGVWAADHSVPGVGITVPSLIVPF